MTKPIFKEPICNKTAISFFENGMSHVEYAQAASIARETAKKWLRKLNADGKIFRVDRCRIPSLFFTTQEEADALKQQLKRKTTRMMRAQGTRFNPDVTKRVDNRPVVTPSHVKTQIGASCHYDPRYQCAPGEQPYGAGFSAAGIGRYL